MKDDVNFLHLRSFCHGNQDQELEHIPCHVDNVTNLVRSMSSMGMSTYISPALHRLFISESECEFMRCDLHVHSMASGMFDLLGINRICREFYNDPVEVYGRRKQLGMSIVPLTDHDSIEGSEPLRRYPDFFLSEEVTVRMPSGTETHLGVYAITERNHVEIQRRRNDLIPLLIYSDRAKAVLQREHVFSGLTGREAEDFQWFASYVPAFETRNGQMQVEANASAARLAARLEKIAIAGSDSHTMAGAGRTYTGVSGARTVDEFFGGLRKGQGRIGGEHGSYRKLTADVFHIHAHGAMVGSGMVWG